MSFDACDAGADDGTGQQQQMVQGNGQHYPSREITYADFVSDAMWNKMTKGLKKDQKACMKAPLVYAELMSYIKGSAEALEAGGHLSLEQYLEVWGSLLECRGAHESTDLLMRLSKCRQDGACTCLQDRAAHVV